MSTNDIQIFCPMDFRKLPVKPESVDLILTDPMYHKKFLHHWSEVGEWASKILKPTGMFLAFTGSLFLDEVMKRLSDHLHYEELLYLVFDAPNRAMHGKRRCVRKYTKLAVLYCSGTWANPNKF